MCTKLCFAQLHTDFAAERSGRLGSNDLSAPSLGDSPTVQFRQSRQREVTAVSWPVANGQLSHSIPNLTSKHAHGRQADKAPTDDVLCIPRPGQLTGNPKSDADFV